MPITRYCRLFMTTKWLTYVMLNTPVWRLLQCLALPVPQIRRTIQNLQTGVAWVVDVIQGHWQCHRLIEHIRLTIHTLVGMTTLDFRQDIWRLNTTVRCWSVDAWFICFDRHRRATIRWPDRQTIRQTDTHTALYIYVVR